MSDPMLLATRKGLFAVERGAGGWSSDLVGFAGVVVTHVYCDSDRGMIYAALKHGQDNVKQRQN